MKLKKRFILAGMFTLCLFCISTVQAQIPAAEERFDIPVVVNIIGNSDSSGINGAIKQAN